MASTFVARGNTPTIDWGMAILAGILAMIVFAIIEMAFSWAMRGTSPLRPLVIFGTVTLNALSPSTPVGGGIRTAAVGAVLLLALGALSGVILGYLVHRLGVVAAAIAGALFGLAMYAVDLYGVAQLFPSLVDLRDWMSALAYGIQGALTAGLYKVMTHEDVEPVREGGHDLRDLRDVRLV
jgi:O-antigen/teichoic acid export membrane protein